MPGPVHNWMGDCLGLPGAVYTRTCVQLCHVLGLREPSKSDSSSDWAGHKRTSMDVGAVPVWQEPRKSTMCEYLAHKANLFGMKNSLMCLNGSSAVYLPVDWVGIWMITGLAKLLSMISALNSLRLDTCAIYDSGPTLNTHFVKKLMNIQYLNLPFYPNMWLIWLIRQGLAWRSRCVKPCCREDGYMPHMEISGLN